MGDSGTFDFMARIALNGRLLVPGKLEGIGRFTLTTFRGLVSRRPNDQFLLVVDRPYDELFDLGPNVEVRRIRIPARRPWLIRWWFAGPLRRVLKAWKADAFVSTEGPLATSMPADFPQMTVIHDLNFEHRPGDLPQKWASFYQKMFPRYARIAKVLGTVSEFSKMDLASSYNLDASDIRVFPNAADEAFSPASETTKFKVQAELAGGNPYFIYVGSFHPRKNVEGVMKAFEQYVEQGGQWRLVMVGEAMWSEGALSGEGFDRVHLTGRLNDTKLVEAVSSASGMVFVPWFEGFGVPVIEAMSCGVPVIASNVTSLPEVCDEAAFALVAPGDTMAIAKAMLRLEQDQAGALEASTKGLARAGKYSWTHTVEAFDAAVDSLLKAKP
jgi:glycosyltransferase involved in cell wall biosynthesis